LDVPEDARHVARIPKSADGLGEYLPLAVELASLDDGKVTDEAPGEPELIGDVISCAIDWHCMAGRRSLAYLSKASDRVRKFFSARPEVVKMGAVAEALFETQGGLLNRKVSGPLSDEIHRFAIASYVGRHGLSWDDHLELVEIMRAESVLIA